MENKEKSENNVEKTLTPQEKLAEFEAQKMTRRQALGRFGFLAGAAAVAALSVDDLARLAGNEMSRRAAGNKVVEQVAKELQNAGVAFADSVPCYAQSGDCFQCCNQQAQSCQAACGSAPIGCGGGAPLPWCYSYYYCMSGCSYGAQLCPTQCNVFWRCSAFKGGCAGSCPGDDDCYKDFNGACVCGRL